MPLKLTELKRLFDKAYNSDQVNQERVPEPREGQAGRRCDAEIIRSDGKQILADLALQIKEPSCH